MERRVTPEHITHLDPNQVFVFGSSARGAHGKGAALTAKRKFGARIGQGDGLQGHSYGISTKDCNICTLPLDRIADKVARFIRFAAEHPELTFLVTPIGCGLAGYKPSQIAPMFRDTCAMENVWLPECFWRELDTLIMEASDAK